MAAAATISQMPAFPGHVISTGSPDKNAVRSIQHRLNQLGCGPIGEDGSFGGKTEEAVHVFQSRSVDQFGTPLTVDGRVGPGTWAALFATEIPTATQSETPLQEGALQVASSQVGSMENPLGSNRGPQVDVYLRSVGINPAAGSFPWCAAFVYFCFQEAASKLGVANPAIKDAGVLDCWNKAGTSGVHRIATSEAVHHTGLVKPGLIFLLKVGSISGHMGLIEKVEGERLTTIEGNTNTDGSREGIGVFRRTGRTIAGISLGFLDYR